MTMTALYIVSSRKGKSKVFKQRPIFEILPHWQSPAKLQYATVIAIPPHLKRVATIPCEKRPSVVSWWIQLFCIRVEMMQYEESREAEGRGFPCPGKFSPVAQCPCTQLTASECKLTIEKTETTPFE